GQRVEPGTRRIAAGYGHPVAAAGKVRGIVGRIARRAAVESDQRRAAVLEIRDGRLPLLYLLEKALVRHGDAPDARLVAVDAYGADARGVRRTGGAGQRGGRREPEHER